ncbi:general secretion pathway protein C [Pseudoduganella flava]|uniref:General secretion pathway protein C n=1 Tax=Pseudoduganella flava TaxID=871742 RepID=A0A562PP59_9BURK|nr:type II secretion system protein N [Pseudoduganella flava]TWI46148.1 general secretion pathway protein C [Pseudoduganella flava]
MNRSPLIHTLVTLAAVVALTASTAYWGLQLFKPQQRPIAAVPLQEAPPAPVDAALGLFGGQAAVATASTYQLRGVVAARDGRGSVAIISANNEPPKAYPVGKEIAPGVTVQDVQPRYVVLLDGGVQKRLELLADDGVSSTTAAPLAPVNRAAPPPPMPSPSPTPTPAPVTQPPPAAPAPATTPSATPMVTPPPGTPVGPPGQTAPVQTAPAQRPVTSG